jgi:3-methylfumaryl-CoA hydratase
MDDIAHLKTWVGRSETVEDTASPMPLAGLAALLDHAQPPWRDGELPPLAHWLYFLNHAPQSDIDVDGHPRRGGFLPPVTLPRRMWAGSRIEFRGSIPIGAAITRRSTIANVSAKNGASGAMIFVTAKHEVSANGQVAIAEEQDIVFREAPKPGAATRASLDAQASEWTRTITPDPTLLFRFSALTFNAHRIHYDRDYCRDVEGYPGLVVQAPLTALLLMDHHLRQRPRADVARFEFRAQRPLFDTAPFEVCGNGGALWARGPDGSAAMIAKIEAR